MRGTVRVFSLRVHLVGMVTRHPQLFIHKAQAVINPLVRGKLRARRHRVCAPRVRDDLIRDRVAHAVLFAGVAQQADGARIKLLRRLLFGINIILINLHGAGARSASGVRFDVRIHGHQLVVDAVHVHIQTEVVDVLVGGADNIMVDQRTVSGVILRGGIMHGFRLHAFHRFNARGPCINADGAVFVEYPVEDIIVVTHGADPAHHQLAALGADVGFT